MHNRVFHQARIGGMTFDGIVAGDGPYLSCRMNGGVALGVSGLRYFQPLPEGTHRTPPLGWWVVKYHREERIFLPGFDRDAIRALSDEFGLPVLAESGFDPSRQRTPGILLHLAGPGSAAPMGDQSSASRQGERHLRHLSAMLV